MNKDIINCLKFDIKEGIYKKFLFYIFFLVVVIIIGIDISKKLNFNIEAPGFFDILLKMMEGKKEFIYVKGGEGFKVPLEYFTIFILMGFGSAYYASKEWHLRGSLYIIRYRNKYSWWLSKGLWNICNVFVMYILLIIGIILVNLITGGTDKLIHNEIYNLLLEPIMQKGINNIILNVIVLGFITIVALNQLQITLQILFSPVVGFITYLIIIITSAFYLSPFLPGNYLMVVREEISRTDGVLFLYGILLMSSIWIVSFVVGMFNLKKKDIF